MIRKNKTKYAILGLLSHQPASGYDIKKAYEHYIGKFWSESYGQIYPATKSLVDEGYSTCEVERSDGKPDRHVFSITDKGMEELREWLAQPTEPHKERLEVLLKLMCGAHMPIEANIRLIERFRDEWQNHLKSYAEIRADLHSEYENNHHLPYWLMAVNCGMYLGNAYIAWCDETIATLKSKEEDHKEPSKQ
ncbi:PadR family transcriptional regulator [bacterium]|nr:PadR family transcriptional regulator [bacterium]